MRQVGAAIAALFCLLQPAQASQFYGLLVAETLRFSMGAEHARVVVAVPGPTACRTGNRYTYQNEGAGLSWTDMLIEAKLHNNVVLIVAPASATPSASKESDISRCQCPERRARL